MKWAWVAMALCACAPPPPEVPCEPFVGMLKQESWPLVLEGQLAQLRATSPLTTCASDEVSALVEVVDATGLTVGASLGTVDRQQGQARVTVAFTPRTPGEYHVRVYFQPSLGAVQQVLVVAQDKMKVVPRLLALPAGLGCERVWRLPQDDLVCQEAAAQVTVVRGGAALAVFRGASVTVAGAVIWSVDDATHLLERRVVEPGGVRLTGTVGEVDALIVNAMDTEVHAVRAQRLGGQVRASWDGVMLTKETQALALRGWAFYEGDELWQGGALGVCSDTRCVGSVQFLGVTGAAVWGQTGSQALMVRRPLTAKPVQLPVATGDVVMGLPTGPTMSPMGVLAGPRLVLPVATEQGALLQVWPAGGLLGVDDEVVMRSTSVPGQVALYDR
jgi:hypothetical protein